MMHRHLAALLLLPLGFAAALPLSSAETTVGVPSASSAEGNGEIESLVAEEVGRAPGRELGMLWQRARQLREAEGLGGEGELDRVLDSYLDRAKELPPAAVLLLVASRLQGADLEPGPLGDALQPLLQGDDEALARGAVSLLGDRKFRRLNRSSRNGIVDLVLEVAEDASRTPGARLDFALGAYRLGAGTAKQKAYRVMESFLNSKDPELSGQGALTIAATFESDVSGRLRNVLEGLAKSPTDQGRLATAYLEVEDERAHGERNLREARKELDSSSKLPKAYEELAAVRRLILEQHLEGDRVKPDELMGSAVDGMLRWMDAHSSFFPSAEYAKFMTELEAEYGGIGAYVREDPDNGLFTIVRPIYSGPAYRSGLQTDDKIVRIGDWPTLGQTETDIIKRLKGKPGTPVELYIWKRGMDPELIDRPTDDMRVSVTREQIEIPAGSNQMLPGGVGLIELTAFNRRSQEQLEQWIPQMEKDGMKALILDMRRNSGGLLSEARDVADLFLGPGKVVVKTEARMGEPEFHLTEKPPTLSPEIPVVILTSRMTASAAEIVAGALQDYDRATLVGKRTYGKGSVQQLLPILPYTQDEWTDLNGNYRWDEGEPITVDHDGDGEFDYCPRVKLTIARYLLPSGRSIHRQLDREGKLISPGGVEPDFTVETGLIERWRFEESARVQRSETLKDYVEEHYDPNRELFHHLAVNDLKDSTLYPEFDRLMMQLETSLSRNDVRTVLRGAIRRRAQDDLGQEFPYGDYVEDLQVQKGIEVVLNQLGISVDDVTEYGMIFDLARAEAHDGKPMLASSNEEIGRMRNLLEAARTDGNALSEENLEELLRLVGRIEDEGGKEN